MDLLPSLILITLDSEEKVDSLDTVRALQIVGPTSRVLVSSKAQPSSYQRAINWEGVATKDSLTIPCQLKEADTDEEFVTQL